jgi:hypothetical protein
LDDLVQALSHSAFRPRHFGDLCKQRAFTIRTAHGGPTVQLKTRLE